MYMCRIKSIYSQWIVVRVVYMYINNSLLVYLYSSAYANLFPWHQSTFVSSFHCILMILCLLVTLLLLLLLLADNNKQQLHEIWYVMSVRHMNTALNIHIGRWWHVALFQIPCRSIHLNQYDLGEAFVV